MLHSAHKFILQKEPLGTAHVLYCARKEIGTRHVAIIFPDDIVLSKDALNHDMDATGFGYEPGIIPRMDNSIFVADEKLLNLAKEVNEEGEEQDPRAELVERLLEYKMYKYMSYELKDMQMDGDKFLYKQEVQLYLLLDH